MITFGITSGKPSAAMLAGASRSSSMLFGAHGRGEKGDHGLKYVLTFTYGRSWTCATSDKQNLT